MSQIISKYSISRRLIVAFALAAVLPGVAIAIIGFYYVGQLNSRGQVANLTSSAQQQTNSLASKLGNMYRYTHTLESQVLGGLRVVNPDVPSNIDSQVQQIKSTVEIFESTLQSYQTNYNPTSGNMAPVLDALSQANKTKDVPDTASNLLNYVSQTSWPSYQKAQTAEINLLGRIVKDTQYNHPDVNGVTKYTLQIVQLTHTLDATYEELSSDWTQITSYVTQMSADANSVSSNNTQSIILGALGAFLLTLSVVAVSGIAVQRSISSPLSELVSLTKRISRGDTAARASVNNSHDEISIVANSMNNMLDNIVHLIQNTQAQRDVLQGQVEKLVSEVSGVGEGDLRVQAEVTADALGVLADSFNYMVEELGSLVVRVKRVAREIEQSTMQTSDRMGGLVKTADFQIQQIASAAAEVERMALNSQQVTDRAQALTSSAREARFNAQGGRQAVQQTVEGMERIHTNVQETSSKVHTLGERSREINNIVEAISNIAHQTNRLALDAAIQAAMAGENGKGFGAVAADIRRLAERAKEQASSIARIVRSVRDDIGAVAISMRDTERETSAGAKLAEEAGSSLESIFSVIERQAREIEVISQMAMQQQQSSDEVVRIMQVVSESTQISSVSTREAAQNMERMARLAEQLLASVEAFKLRENLNYFAPNGLTIAEEKQNAPGNGFRMITASAQPVSQPGFNPGSYAALSSGASEGNVALPVSPIPGHMQGNTTGRPFFPAPQNSEEQIQPPRGNSTTKPPRWPSPYNVQAENWQ